MNKIVSAFVVAFFLLSIVSAIFDGGGIGTTTLASLMSATSTNIVVTDTKGFLNSGILIIGDEKVTYSSITTTFPYRFNGLTRGIEGTIAKSHIAGSRVFSEDTGVINAALGFNPAAIAVSSGWFATVLIPWNFFVITMPRLVAWNFSFFQGELIVIRYILMIISIGFYIVFAIELGQTIASILKR